MIKWRIAKWAFILSEFDLTYMPIKIVKGQAIADFLTEYPYLQMEENEQNFSQVLPWTMYFDRSHAKSMAGAELIIISPDGKITRCVCKLDFKCSNNQAEYEALIIGLGILIELKVQFIKIFGDSQLVMKQSKEEYQCLNENLIGYYYLAKKQL